MLYIQCHICVYMLTIVGLSWETFVVQIFKPQLLLLDLLPGIKHLVILLYKLNYETLMNLIIIKSVYPFHIMQSISIIQLRRC